MTLVTSPVVAKYVGYGWNADAQRLKKIVEIY